ncbi:MAG: hypothetical protein CMK09_17275 [Ponticaulis sp.]|nr:hypothetical protein [Ponticaulis sp.]|tara:strand:- start:33518 stop:34375 length:858 start_codon:yes stop_codon:yes gene_type:complete
MISDARRINQILRSRGFFPSDFTLDLISEHLPPLQRTRFPPDFTRARKILPDIALPASFRGPVGLIVETRCHDNLAFVTQQVCNDLVLPVVLIHGSENRSFIKERLPDELKTTERLFLVELKTATLSLADYNGLFLLPKFWSSFESNDQVLVFQTDVVFCRNSPYRLSDFQDFAYIGSSWDRSRPVGLILDGGYGGVSLRDPRALTGLLNQFPANDWPGGEDGYFAFYADLMDLKLARPQDSDRFCTQDRFVGPSLAVHKPTRLSKAEREALLSYCPDVHRLFET